MPKLVILDYSDSSINVYNMDGQNVTNTEIMATDLGYNVDDCSIMWCEDNLKINIE